MSPSDPPPSRTEEAWHQLAANEVLHRLGSSPDGLSSAEAALRLQREGANALQAAEEPGIGRILLSQFKSLIIWVLLGAGLIAHFVGDAFDAAAIFAIVFLNALIGALQEYKAGRSIAALRRLTAPMARVLRDGVAAHVPAADLVVGDVLLLEAGDLGGADARLFQCSSLRCVESALTGEAAPVSKQTEPRGPADLPLGDRNNLIFFGTTVVAGIGRAVVVATGMQTQLGRIADLLAHSATERETPLQQRLNALGKLLVWISLGIVALLFGLGWLRGTPAVELIMTTLALAVAAIPESLPAVVTVALSLGVFRMARRHALVRKLAAVEALGAATVICTDKTGTLTLGEMTVRVLQVAGQQYEVLGEGYDPSGQILRNGAPVVASADPLLRALAEGLLGCNQAHLSPAEGGWRLFGDPTEGALLVAGEKAGLRRAELESAWPRVLELPFDSDRRRSSVVRRVGQDSVRVFSHGAPGALLECCTHYLTGEGRRELPAVERERIHAQAAELATRGLRVIASATRALEPAGTKALDETSVEQGLTFLGLSGIYDPPRPEARVAIEECRRAGIRVVMITGDHPKTAAAIATELGLVAKSESEAAILAGPELQPMSETDLQVRVRTTAIFARVTAEHKLRIVRALQANGETVAMTGDGVNDAPAIQGADIGLAMGRQGTEATKQAADLVITDDNFATIVAAVREGRSIYDNIRKALSYLLAGNTAELLLMAGCIAGGLPTPLLPVHLLWINLVTDGLPALCLAIDRGNAEVMQRPPRRRSERLADAAFFRSICVTGLLTAVVGLVAFMGALQLGHALETARGAAFSTLVFAELLRSLGARSESRPFWVGLWANPGLLAVVVLSILVQCWSLQSAALGGFLRTPILGLGEIASLLALGSLPWLLLELGKLRRAATSPAPSASDGQLRTTHGETGET